MQGITKDARGGLIVNEPVMAGFIAVWLVGQVGAYIVGKAHWVDQATFDALSNKLVAVVSFAVLAGIGWLVRHVVAPAWKLIDQQSAKAGVVFPELPTFTDAEADVVLANASVPVAAPLPPDPAPAP